MPVTDRALRLAAAVGPGGLAVVAVVLLTGAAGPAAVAVDDLTQLLAAVGAALACRRAARRTLGRRRASWSAMTVGCGAWAAGQAVWSCYEIGLGVRTPFPSAADVGYLVFPVAVAVALLLHPASSATSGERSRRLLDGLLVTASLVMLSWVTALDAVLQRDDHPLRTAVALAYPAGDVLVLTMVVLLLRRTTTDRRVLTLLGAGIATLALADSAFLYLTHLDRYDGHLHLLGLGWAGGFLLVTLAALTTTDDDEPAPAGTARPGRRLGLLPYAPIGIALGVAIGRVVTGGPQSRTETALTSLVVVLVLLRQYTLVRDHASLLEVLAGREDELRRQAFHDGLTGLVNRALFRDRVAQALDQRQRHGRPLSLLFCDLDDFKLVNDTLGHATGDALLVAVAQRLEDTLRAGDTLARLGGDEFAVLLRDGEDPSTVAVAMLDALDRPLSVGGRELVVRMSVGATTVPAGVLPSPSVDALLSQADTAMYAVKRDGGAAVCAFTPGMALAEVTEADLAAALADAIATGGITLVHQPVVDVATGRVEGLEALARWSHDDRPVPPEEFIALAERNGLIAPLTARVLDVACAQAAAWARPGLRVGVNLSPSCITDPSLPDLVARTLASHGIDGSALVLEITESGVLQDPGIARQVCGELRRQGVLLALDDFGVGFASLAHLDDLPLDIVKLDRSLLVGVGTDPRRTGFVRAVLRLATDLGLQVVAEGVEEPAQLEGLRAMGMHMAQGSLLCRPAPAERLTPLLDGALGLPATAFA